MILHPDKSKDQPSNLSRINCAGAWPRNCNIPDFGKCCGATPMLLLDSPLGEMHSPSVSTHLKWRRGCRNSFYQDKIMHLQVGGAKPQRQCRGRGGHEEHGQPLCCPLATMHEVAEQLYLSNPSPGFGRNWIDVQQLYHTILLEFAGKKNYITNLF